MGFTWHESNTSFARRDQLFDDGTGQLLGAIYKRGIEELWDADDARKRPYADLGQYLTRDAARRAVENVVARPIVAHCETCDLDKHTLCASFVQSESDFYALECTLCGHMMRCHNPGTVTRPAVTRDDKLCGDAVRALLR